MIVRIGNFEFVLTPVPDSDRRVIVVRETGSNSEICIDMTKHQAATLGDAVQALGR